MSELDRITAGERERSLVAMLHQEQAADREWDGLRLPFFVKLQVQTSSYCNAACATCPYPETSKSQSMGRMSEELFAAIVDQIAGRRVERTSLFLMNEPLVDRRLEAFTSLLKSRVPDTTATIITNGSLLDGDRARALAAAGMDEISVSINGFTARDYEQTMAGLDFARIMHNLTEVAAALAGGDLGGMELRVVALDLGEAHKRADEFRDKTGLPVFLKPLTNRAGSVDVGGLASQVERTAPRRPCQRPFVKAYVLFDGTMVLCNCDWQRTTRIGNVREQGFEELWNGPILDTIRRQHATGCLPSESLCARCDYPYLI